jgi:hypothetical protein
VLTLFFYDIFNEMKKFIHNISALTLIMALLMSGVYAAFEPEAVNAVTTVSDTVLVNLTVDSSISITSPADATMSPNIDVSNNSSIASTAWNVKTNDPDGYTLSIKNASTAPALKNLSGGANFADYTEAVPGTPETWSVDSGTFQFGYSAYGTDVNTTTYGTGASCGSSGTPLVTLKYRHASTTNVVAATRSATTTTTGVDTNVCWAAGQNGVFAPAGTYQATITATATVI